MVTNPDVAAVGKPPPLVQNPFPDTSYKNQNRSAFEGPAQSSELSRDLDKFQTHFDPTYNEMDGLNRRLAKAVAPRPASGSRRRLVLDNGDITAPQCSTHPGPPLDRLFSQLEGVNHSYSGQSWREVQGAFESIHAFPFLKYKILSVSGVALSFPIL